MYKILFLLWMLLNSSQNISEEEIIQNINRRQKYWVAGKNNVSHLLFRHRLKISKVIGIDRIKKIPNNRVKIPKYFDSRRSFYYCKNIINDVPDQGICGSCWAVTLASVFADRKCIATEGSYHMQLSAEDMTTCCIKCALGKNGCDGGDPEQALSFLEKVGTVTGSHINSSKTEVTWVIEDQLQVFNLFIKVQGCKPYSKFVWSFGTNSSLPLICEHKCTNEKYRESYWNDKNRISEWHMFPPGDVQTIQRNIMMYGPVMACIKSSTELFKYYKGGVYTGVADPDVKHDHGIVIIGWGTEYGIHFWYCRNSWGREWGMRGYFKIIRGHNTLGIEEQVFALYIFGGRTAIYNNTIPESSNSIHLPNRVALIIGFLLMMTVK